MSDKCIAIEFKHSKIFTNFGIPIDFKVFKIEKEDCYWTKYVIKAYIHEESAGYISIQYIDEENKFLKTCLDSWVHQYADSNISMAWKSKNTELFVKLMNEKFPKDIIIEQNEGTDKKLEKVSFFVHQIHEQKYNKLINQWLMKPSVEIVNVYGKDDKDKDFSIYPHINIDRKNIDFKKQGIGTALYQVASEMLDTKHLSIFESPTQTQDGKALWSYFKDIAKFHLDQMNGRKFIKMKKMS